MCSTTLKQWKSGKCDDQRLPLVTPMAWHYQLYHKREDCYFCQKIIVGHHYKTRHRIKYAHVLTVSKLISREEQYKPTADRKPENSPESSNTSSSERSDEPYIPTGTIDTESHFVSNQHYRDLVRDLELSSR